MEDIGMEYMLVHTARGIFTPEMLAPMMEQSKQMAAKPSAFVPGGKLVGSYVARNKAFIVCIWDVPNVENLSGMVEMMEMAGWDTDINLCESFAAHIERVGKAMAAMKK
jgi:hypothetical protein